MYLLADINAGSGNSSQSSFIEIDGKLWFSANNGESDSRLWQYDPQTEAASLLADLHPDGSSNPPGLQYSTKSYTLPPPSTPMAMNFGNTRLMVGQPLLPTAT